MMKLVKLDGKTYGITASGRVMVSYEHPNAPDQIIWRRVLSNGPRASLVRQAAGLEPAPEPMPQLSRARHYVQLHYTSRRRGCRSLSY